MTQDRALAAGTQPRPDTDPGGPATQDSGEALSEIFWAVARQLREASQETLAPWDITPAHLRALRALGHHGAMRLSDLSGRLHIAPRSATEVVDALESAAWSSGGPTPVTGAPPWSR